MWLTSLEFIDDDEIRTSGYSDINNHTFKLLTKEHNKNFINYITNIHKEIKNKYNLSYLRITYEKIKGNNVFKIDTDNNGFIWFDDINFLLDPDKIIIFNEIKYDKIFANGDSIYFPGYILKFNKKLTNDTYLYSEWPLDAKKHIELVASKNDYIYRLVIFENIYQPTVFQINVNSLCQDNLEVLKHIHSVYNKCYETIKHKNLSNIYGNIDIEYTMDDIIKELYNI